MGILVTPKQIRERALKLWEKGALLSSILRDEAVFPLTVPFRKPSAKELLRDFAAIREELAELHGESKNERGVGYTVHTRSIKHRTLGEQCVPQRIVFEERADFLKFIRKEREFDSLKALFTETEALFPSLALWLIERPRVLLQYQNSWRQLLDVCRYFQANSAAGRFLRELNIPGVDSKFIEAHRKILSALLTQILPPEAIDENISRLSGSGFERRFGLRFDEPRIRFRVLDPALLHEFTYSDISVAQSEFAARPIACRNVFIVENVKSGLSFPPTPGSILIFGMGYGVAALREAKWLNTLKIHYWGDIDTHGFAILSMLRSFLPQVESLIMDEAALLAHRDLWVPEPPERRFTGELEHLIEDEQALFRALRGNHFGYAVRLEQERIYAAYARERLEEATGGEAGRFSE